MFFWQGFLTQDDFFNINKKIDIFDHDLDQTHALSKYVHPNVIDLNIKTYHST